MSRFHHLWVVDAEIEIRNPAPGEDVSCGERIFEALSRYASDESDPYPAQVVREDDRWAELTFPVWAPTRFAAAAVSVRLRARPRATASARSSSEACSRRRSMTASTSACSPGGSGPPAVS